LFKNLRPMDGGSASGQRLGSEEWEGGGGISDRMKQVQGGLEKYGKVPKVVNPVETGAKRRAGRMRSKWLGGGKPFAVRRDGTASPWSRSTVPLHVSWRSVTRGRVGLSSKGGAVEAGKAGGMVGSLIYDFFYPGEGGTRNEDCNGGEKNHEKIIKCEPTRLYISLDQLNI